MGRLCRVCSHERSAEIGRDLLHGVSYRAIAKRLHQRSPPGFVTT
jgi:hypothetical protein